MVVAAALGDAMGEHFPKPLVVDVERGSVLLRDFGQVLNTDEHWEASNHKLYQRIQKDWTEIQKLSVDICDELKGVPVQDAAWLRKT